MQARGQFDKTSDTHKAGMGCLLVYGFGEAGYDAGLGWPVWILFRSLLQ
jgi:hypothetical protein